LAGAATRCRRCQYLYFCTSKASKLRTCFWSAVNGLANRARRLLQLPRPQPVLRVAGVRG
jgi:hypothetical protein